LRLFLAGVCAAAASAGLTPPVRSAQGRRLTSGKSVAGSFELGAVHAVHLKADEAVHVRHEVVPRDPSSRRLTPGDIAFGTRRDVVRSFMALNVAILPDVYSWSEEFLEPIIQAGDSLYGPNIASPEEELRIELELYNGIIQDLEEASDEYGDVHALGLDVRASEGSGVHAMEFYKEGFGTVVVFRGSYSGGDYDQFAVWTSDWIMTRMAAQLKYQWINRAGLEWTDEMAAREDMHVDVLVRAAFSAGAWMNGGAFLDGMVNASVAHEELDAAEVARTGYWELTKTIADSVRESVSANARTPLYITGHSQGGARASLVSMYFEKRYNESIETITFSGIGTSCLSRGSSGFGGTYHTDLTADVDPFIHHPQITDYSHVLDALGFMDYDAGSHCTFGTSDAQTSAAARWCANMFGYSGAHLFTAGSLPNTGTIETSFERCRYFTHVWQGMIHALANDNYLFEDGTTDGGCSPAGPISREDPQSLCNTGSGLWEVDGCNDQLSCETCSVSSTADLVGFQCFWCASSLSCHARGITWLSGCDSGYIGGNTTQCEAGAADRFDFDGIDAAILSGAPQWASLGGAVVVAGALLLAQLLPAAL